MSPGEPAGESVDRQLASCGSQGKRIQATHAPQFLLKRRRGDNSGHPALRADRNPSLLAHPLPLFAGKVNVVVWVVYATELPQPQIREVHGLSRFT